MATVTNVTIKCLMDEIRLHDCYINRHGPAYMTGTQALVRLLLEQARLDREQGINSRGLVSGYPGSPLGGLDLELNRNLDLLEKDGVTFQPAINEELAATAIWGSQHIHLYDQPEIDGVCHFSTRDQSMTLFQWGCRLLSYRVWPDAVLV